MPLNDASVESEHKRDAVGDVTRRARVALLASFGAATLPLIAAVVATGERSHEVLMLAAFLLLAIRRWLWQSIPSRLRGVDHDRMSAQLTALAVWARNSGRFPWLVLDVVAAILMAGAIGDSDLFVRTGRPFAESLVRYGLIATPAIVLFICDFVFTRGALDYRPTTRR